jgi:hypothetical protein
LDRERNLDSDKSITKVSRLSKPYWESRRVIGSTTARSESFIKQAQTRAWRQDISHIPNRGRED